MTSYAFSNKYDDDNWKFIIEILYHTNNESSDFFYFTQSFKSFLTSLHTTKKISLIGEIICNSSEIIFASPSVAQTIGNKLNDSTMNTKNINILPTVKGSWEIYYMNNADHWFKFKTNNTKNGCVILFNKNLKINQLDKLLWKNKTIIFDKYLGFYDHNAFNNLDLLDNDLISKVDKLKNKTSNNKLWYDYVDNLCHIKKKAKYLLTSNFCLFDVNSNTKKYLYGTNDDKHVMVIIIPTLI